MVGLVPRISPSDVCHSCLSFFMQQQKTDDATKTSNIEAGLASFGEMEVIEEEPAAENSDKSDDEPPKQAMV